MKGVHTVNLTRAIFWSGLLIGNALAATSGVRPDPPRTSITIRQTELATVVFREHIGPYWTVGPLYQQVADYMLEHEQTGPMYARFDRDPTGSDAAALRTEVGFVAEPGHHATPPFLTKRQNSEWVAVMIVEGSRSRTLRHYPAISAWITSQGYTRVGPIVEIYHSKSERPSDKVAAVDLTEIRMVIQPPTAERHAVPDTDPATGSKITQVSIPSATAVRLEVEGPALDETQPDPIQPSTTDSSIAELVLARRFDDMANRMLPNDCTVSGEIRIWLGQIVLRLNAVSNGVDQLYPDNNATIRALCEAVRRRYGELPAAPDFDARDYSVMSPGRPIGRDALTRQSVSRRIDRLLGRIATRAISPDDILEELSSLVQQVSEVVVNED